MLTESTVIATVPVADVKRATKFYTETLGFKKKGETSSDESLLTTGETDLELYKSSVPPKGEHTVATFEVNNLESEIKELKDNGVKFEDYDLPELKTKNHIAEKNGMKAAWFKDSEGNILCLHEKNM